MTDCIMIPVPLVGLTLGPVNWFAPSGAINVMWWGLPNDGSNAATVWAALRTHLQSAGGGVIYFPPGVYGFGASLSLLDNLHVIGDGPDVRSIKAISGVTTALVLG